MISFNMTTAATINMEPFRVGSAMAHLLSDGVSRSGALLSNASAIELIHAGQYDDSLAAIVAAGYTAERGDDFSTGDQVSASETEQISAIVLG